MQLPSAANWQLLGLPGALVTAASEQCVQSRTSAVRSSPGSDPLPAQGFPDSGWMASEPQPQRKVVLCLGGLHNTHKENKHASLLAWAKGASPRG